jgi:hypothetical protein
VGRVRTTARTTVRELVNMMPSRLPIGAEMGLRKGKRYGLSAPAFYWFERADGTLQEAQGTTRDISGRGVFVVAELLPSPGAHVKLDVYLPSVGLRPRSVQLHGEGTVLRVGEVGTNHSGFAAEVLFHTESYDAATVLGPKGIQ